MIFTRKYIHMQKCNEILRLMVSNLPAWRQVISGVKYINHKRADGVKLTTKHYVASKTNTTWRSTTHVNGIK